MFLGGRDFDFSRRVYVMGILNVTPDSFSDGGSFLDPQAALDHALRLQEEGADLIDVGAESTRPGASAVSEEEEKARLLPVVRKLLPKLKVPLSIDTQKARIADAALSEGAAMINDVSALGDPAMPKVLASRGAPVILMHRKGSPETMQKNPHYEDVIGEVRAFLEERIAFAAGRGIGRDLLLIDPGLGFGKRLEDNLALLNRLSSFQSLNVPVVIGASRKSFLRKIFGEEGLAMGNAAAESLAIAGGARMLRVHDVAAAKAVIRLADAASFP
jgi:dihydropteroate synthase